MLHYRTLAYRRMAAVALAIRLFEADYGGPPIELSELVPAYLQALPADPFSADGRTFGYLPDTPPPRLYSVNRDGIDDGGEFSAATPQSRANLDLLDLPFFLTRDFPRTLPQLPMPPSSQALVDDAEPGDAGGQSHTQPSANIEP